MEDNKQLELTDLWNIIKCRINLIISITLCAVIFTGILNYCVIKPVYEAECSIIIGTAPQKVNAAHDSNSVDILMYQSLMKTYSSIAKSQLVINSTADKLKNSKLKKLLSKNLTVSLQENTQIMIIKYKSTDPKEAKTTLDALIECFMEQTQRIYPTDSINIIDKVEIPKEAVKPNKLYNLILGFFLALILSSIMAFLLDFANKKVKSERDIEKKLKLNVLGTVPNICYQPYLLNKKATEFETYRIIKNNIEFYSKNKKIQSVAVISPSQGDGKTTFALNLAEAFSEEGNTVLIDCNLRNPKVHEIFRVSKAKGLSELVAESADYYEVIKATCIKNLYVITSGSSIDDPSEIISSIKMKSIIKALKGKFDYIVLDTPKVIMVSDAQVLSQYCDGCVFVISSDMTLKTEAIKAIELLLKINANIIGAVLNKSFEVKENFWKGFIEKIKVKVFKWK